MSVITIFGAGVMGKGVAQVLLEHGHKVYLNDISEELLSNAKVDIKRSIMISRMMNKQIDANIINNLTFVTDYSSLKESDYIIENITENVEMKSKLYSEIVDYCQEDTIFMVNTSCISITKIGAITKRPDRVVGTHFMNPVPMMKAVEVIKGFYTSEKTIQRTKDLLTSLNKEGIVVNDFPGFVSNRISHLMMNEAAFIVQDQVADIKTVDEIFKKCYSHKMGPLETADLIGIDTVVESLQVLYDSYQDPKFRCCPLLKKMVDAGLLGRKSGRGFYEYR
jgi:3-hydroxybutyryl-CoA dehydrogenase